jgi:hypothetical protein
MTRGRQTKRYSERKGSSVVGKRETRLYEPKPSFLFECTAVVGTLRPELFVVLAFHFLGAFIFISNIRWINHV